MDRNSESMFVWWNKAVRGKQCVRTNEHSQSSATTHHPSSYTLIKKVTKTKLRGSQRTELQDKCNSQRNNAFFFLNVKMTSGQPNQKRYIFHTK